MIDASPNISTTLMALGICINEIEGIFHTHAHDDHFAGLTALIHADHRIKYYTTSIVRASVAKKLAALLSWESDYMNRFFDIHDLEFNVWNNIEGLEVKPAISPQQLETATFTFRALWEGGYRSYAHLANLASFGCLENMITEDSSKPGISLDFYNQVREDFLAPVNLKKVDAGGGLIHGDIKDFLEDTSDKIIRTYTSSSMSIEEKKISSNAPFGMIDVLIPACQDYSMQRASNLLRNYFPDATVGDLQMLLNFNIVSFNAGSILLKEGSVTTHIYLVLTGTVEVIHSEQHNQSLISTMGSLLGELSGLMTFPSMETYRTASFVRTIKIPSNIYRDFVKRNKLYSKIERIANNRSFLQRTWLFGEMLSYPVINNIANKINIRSYSKGENIQIENKSILILLKEGEIIISTDGKVINTIHPGDFCGEENILNDSPEPYEICATEDSDIYEIPGNILEDIPVVLWKLLETSEKRIKHKSI
ncbi:MAG: cyclic nucleotide-binding domain-containing protein [Gammaproteobacteria bacterium]|nr:cyclic nucleotide-binding domain-containing protein [Gammaproteobacteria bacterium]